MNIDPQEARLAATYEAIRRREYEVITELLELLPRIEGVSEERVGQVRDALFHADHPFLMVFFGPFSSGKSSLINALLGTRGLLAVGPIPTTDRITILRWGENQQTMDSAGEAATVFHPSPLLKKVSFVDTPGLESVFQKHEATTNRFLHRSDVVVLVMLATQAMTQRNVDYIQKLREYGKRVIVAINQADLLTPEEAATVKEYVINQSKDRLNYEPQVWMVSAKLGLDAYQPDGSRDEALWQQSGLDQFERYFDEQLSDVERIRQKLQTPLQIIQNTHKIALEAVRANQSTLDQYQSIKENVEQQLAAYKRDQERAVREINEQIRTQFGEASLRGGEAIRDIFQLSRAFGSLRRGLLDLTGLSRLFNRGERPVYTRQAFEQYRVYEPLNKVPEIAAQVGPRLEGQDMQAIDDLVKYANHEIHALPLTISNKVIGELKPPMLYDRKALQTARPALELVESESREAETMRLEHSLRNVLFMLVVWEALMIFTLGLALTSGTLDFSDPIAIGIVALLLGLALFGFALLPLSGRLLENAHTARLIKFQNQYIEQLTEAADKQIAYGMQLRRDSVAPLIRLVETQADIQKQQLNHLQAIAQQITDVEAELTKLTTKKGLFGR